MPLITEAGEHLQLVISRNPLAQARVWPPKNCQDPQLSVVSAPNPRRVDLWFPKMSNTEHNFSCFTQMVLSVNCTMDTLALFLLFIIYKLFLSQISTHYHFFMLFKWSRTKQATSSKFIWPLTQARELYLYTFSYTKHVKFIFTHATFVSNMNDTHLVSAVNNNALMLMQICRFDKTKTNLQAIFCLFRRWKSFSKI